MQIVIDNFDALINNCHIHHIFKDLPHNEIVEFAVELKNFYDRMISIAQKGVPVPVIKDIMAHSDVKTTMRHVHTAEEQMKKAVK